MLAALPGMWHAARARNAIVGAFRRRAPRGLVLMYHRVAGPRRDPQALDVSPEHFDAQLAVIARTAAPLPLGEFELMRRAGRLPRRAIAVTFDDGYADNLHAATPILARHGIAATVFVTSGMVGSAREFWWDDIERIAFAPSLPAGRVPGNEAPWSETDAASVATDAATDRWSLLCTEDPTPRHRLYRALSAALHALPAPEREARLTEWRAWSNVAAEGRASHRTMTIDELRTLAAQSRISIGAHTVSHPSLARISLAEQSREIVESRAWLERTLASPVRMFAYPFGTENDVPPDSVRVASENFDCALATTTGTAWRWSPRWRIPREAVRDWDAAAFAQRLDGWFAS